jgi:hypothetical protein
MIEAFSAPRTIGVALWPTTLATQIAAVTVMVNQISQNVRALSTTLVSSKRNDIDITLFGFEAGMNGKGLGVLGLEQRRERHQDKGSTNQLATTHAGPLKAAESYFPHTQLSTLQH